MSLDLQFLCDNKRHLICQPYSIANLHAMARALGIKPCWFHAGRYPHYDIPKTRIAEIQAKCAVVSTHIILKTIKAGCISAGNLRLVWDAPI